ncbi:MAG: family 20 glycosylhydrolase [Lachnospiraceae bacterium]|nr:family 20 glycosylhydrolase [Lachnospiraceae bacterium]
MYKKIKKWIALSLAMILMLNSAALVGSAATPEELGALLDSYASQSGTFTLDTDSRILVISDGEPAGDLLQTVQLAQRQFAAAGKPGSEVMDIVWGPDESYAKSGDIVVKLDSGSGIGTEGYQLNVAETAAVTASDADGLLYGLNMLLKFLNAYGSSLSGFTAVDAPDTKERTVMLDTGRKYYTKEWICNFIRQISWMGYNTIELHFSEDGGFRADFWDPAYYKGEFQPENDFTWLCGSHVQSWVKDPYRTDPDAGKYLTTAELVEILEVAKEYHIDVIPSFDSPAHMDYITWKFEQNYKSNSSYSFTYNGATYKASSTSGCINYRGWTGDSSPTWPYYTTIDITDGTMAKAFVFALYEDIADFFKEYAGSTDFSIGADEVNLSNSAVKWDYSQFPGYVNELNQMLNGKGYTCRMFNDFIGSTTYNQSSETAVYEFDDNIEIMYWNSDFNPTTGEWDEPIWHVKFFWENNTGSTDNWGDGGRIMYNCIQTNCYYVLRVAASTTDYPNMDARNPENYNWTFYGSNEEDIYNKWYPADISEKGLYTEGAADVPADQLGGAYFLIWNDYASLNTEAEVWNDVKDNTGTSSYVYSLFDRMWSNIIKMWNSDVNSSVSYSAFAAVRDTFGYFPGFTSCSAAASMPAATAATQAYLADHSALNAALQGIIAEQGNYTDDSWSAYQAAVAAAEALRGKASATQAEVDAAVDALKAAEEALTEKVTVDRTKLQELLDAEIAEQGSFTDDSWSVYQTALAAAKEIGAKEDAAQEEIDEAVAALTAAINALAVDPEESSIEITLLRAAARKGKNIGMRIITAAGVETLTVTGNAQPVLCIGKDQTLDSGETIKVWLVYIPAVETGTFNYTVTAGAESATVTVTVK